MKNQLQNTPLNILLADDDQDDCFFFEKALKELQIATDLKTVNDGERLMDYLSKNSEQPPDVLFLDLNMPRKSGSECLKEIKESEKLKNIPVVIYSTSLNDTVADVLYEYGAHYYLQKCDFTHLPNSIQKVLTLLMENSNRPRRNKFVLSTKVHS